MKMISPTFVRLERERRYPFLVAIDLLLHWMLCAGILGCAVSLVWIILLNNSPQLPQQILGFWFKIWN